jgi:serine/alanine adding enzyme
VTSAPGARDTALTVTAFDGPDSQWNQFVDEAAESTFCHSAAWRQVMDDVLGHECLWRVAVDASGAWQGALPLVRVRSSLFGHYLISMPFLNYGGPIGQPEAKRALAGWAVKEASRSGADLLELRSRAVSDVDLAASGGKITVLLALPPGAAELHAGLPAKLRSQIRRPQKEGMSVAFGVEHLDAFYEVFAQNMRDLGTPVLGKPFFERLVSTMPGCVQIGVVHHRSRPVAAGCGFVWRDEFEMTWASSLREFNALAPNMLLYWAFMERMVGLGAKVFNFGRCTPGGGTHRFKRQWGGADTALPWVGWTSKNSAIRPSSHDSRYRIATRIWSRVPVCVTNLVGPSLARLLP